MIPIVCITKLVIADTNGIRTPVNIIMNGKTKVKP